MSDPRPRPNAPRRCVTHGRWMLDPPSPDGTDRCSFYVPELGASEDYGCMTRSEMVAAVASRDTRWLYG